MIPQPEECISPNQKAAPSGAAFACQKASQSSRPAGRRFVLATKDNPRLCRGEKIAYGEGQSRQEKVSELE